MMKPPQTKQQAAIRRRNRNQLALTSAILRDHYGAHATADAVDKIVKQLTDSLDTYEKRRGDD